MRNIALWIGCFMLLCMLFFMYVGPYLPFVDRELTQEKHRFTDIPGKRLEMPPFPPSEKNPLGTDKSGVDNLSKLLLGMKETVYIVIAVAFVRYIIAVPLGIMAYKQKGVAHFILTSLNRLFSYIPTIIAAVLLLSLPTFLNTQNRMAWAIFFIALLEVGRVAHIVQQQTFKLSHEQFVQAGVSLGLSGKRLSTKYYMPAILPEVIVNFCVDVGKVMLLVGQLGVLNIFLSHKWVDTTGFGNYQFVNAGMNWFALLSEHRMDIYYNKFAFVFFPALAIMFVILTFNVLGEGLRHHYNRRMHTYM